MTPAEFRTLRQSIGTQKEVARLLKMGTHGWQSISKWEGDGFDGVIPGPVQVAMEHLANCRILAVTGTRTGTENAN